MNQPQKTIIWSKSDDSLAITYIVDDTLDDQFHIEQIQSSNPDFRFRMVTDTRETIIPNNIFFGAMVLDEQNQFAFDMIKAREIWRNEIRARRDAKLPALDIEYQRADELGDTALKAEIAAKKQELRDAPNNPAIDAAKDLNELRLAITPLLLD